MDIVEQIKAIENKIDTSVKLYKADIERLIKTGESIVKMTKRANYICEVKGCYEIGIYENEVYDCVCIKHKKYLDK